MRFNQIKAFSGFMSQAVKDNLRLGAAEAPKYLNRVKQEVLYKKVGDLNNWYTRVLGLDEVRLYQERVVALQEKLLNVQDRRRGIGQELAEIRSKSNELQDRIHKVKRQDDLQRFLDLMREETEVLKLERQVTDGFNECDREEREVFTAFTNAVRDSHEKQRAQLEYTKYFGLVLSLVGSFLTFCYSTLRKQDLKRFIEEHLMVITGSSEPLLRQLQDNQVKLNKVITYIDHKGPDVVNLINKNHNEMVNLLRDNKMSKLSSMFRPEPVRSQGVPDGQKILVYGCVALVGIVILRTIVS